MSTIAATPVRAQAAPPAIAEDARRESGAWVSLGLALVVPCAVALGAGPTPTLLVVVTLGIVSLALEWEALVALLLGVTFVLGPLKMGFGGWLAYLIPDFLGGLVLLRWMAGEIAPGGGAFRRHPLFVPSAALAAYLVLEVLNPEAPLIRSVFGFRSWVMYTLFVFVGYAGFRSADQLVRLYRVLLVLGLITGAYGVWQWRGGPEALAALGGDYVWIAPLQGVAPWLLPESGQYFRAMSTFMSATMFAINLALVMIIALSLLLWRGSAVSRKIMYGASIVFLGGVITTTGSRMGVVYLAGAVIVIAILFKRVKILLLAVPLGVLAIELGRRFTMGYMSARFQTVFDPDTFWWKWFTQLKGGFMLGVENPFGKGLGYTAGMPSFADPALILSMPAGSLNTIDSGYGMVAAELGIIGLPIFIWFAVAIGLTGLRAWGKLTPETRWLFVAPAISAVVFPVYTFISAPHASLPTSAYVWLFVGMLLRAGDLDAEAQRSSSG